MLNMRVFGSPTKVRALCFSDDGGTTWSGQRIDENLVDPSCQASLLRCRWPDTDSKGCLLFSNPMSTSREKMTIRLSDDEGRTWPLAKRLCDGPSAYSSLAVLSDGSIACLYEPGGNGKYERIVLARFMLDWLSDGAAP